ncbi:AI-2E family transporter [Phreatobacter sp.]|uniref:AI-2E family transporter n=1 Tax=Phreatobacter sp. TaxID=1966341 RepID=UPI003F71380C
MQGDLLRFQPWRAVEPEPEPDDDHGPWFSGDHDPVARWATVGIFVILATAALAIARPIALPVTAGIVFGIMLGPVADSLVRRGVPHGLAAATVVGGGTLCLMSIFAVLAAPVAMGADQIPAIMETLKTRLDGLFDFLRRLQWAADTSSGAPQVELSGGLSLSPLLDIAMTSTSAAGSLLIFVATVYFYLAARRHLKARVLRLCLGRDARQVAGSFFEEVEQRIASYFGVVTVINLGVGAIAATIAWAAGFPYPMFWGALAFALNYLAYVGPLIVTALIFGAGLMNGGTPFQIVWPALAFFLVQIVEGNVIAPVMIGRRLMLSPFVVFLSFVFWLWLWGPVGAILSTPILLVALAMVETMSTLRDAPADGGADGPSTSGDGTADPAGRSSGDDGGTRPSHPFPDVSARR